MNPLAALLSEHLSEAQVVEGSETERWAVCGRVPQAVVFPESEEQVAEVLSLSSEEGWRCVPGGRGSWLNGGQPPQGVDVLPDTTTCLGVKSQSRFIQKQDLRAMQKTSGEL